MVFADIPDRAKCVRAAALTEWDSRGVSAVLVVPDRSPEPLTFHVKHWARRTLPLHTSGASRPQEPSADCRNGPARIFMRCAHPRPRMKAGPQVCSAAELYFLLQATSGGFVPDVRLLHGSRRIELTCPCASIVGKMTFPVALERGSHFTLRSRGSTVAYPCRAGQDGRAPFASSPATCTACPNAVLCS